MPINPATSSFHVESGTIAGVLVIGGEENTIEGDHPRVNGEFEPEQRYALFPVCMDPDTLEHWCVSLTLDLGGSIQGEIFFEPGDRFWMVPLHR